MTFVAICLAIAFLLYGYILIDKLQVLHVQFEFTKLC